MSKEIAKKEQDLPVMAFDMEADAGMGMEHADKSSFAIPFIQMLQGLSPALERVDGSRPGLFINTITDELFKEVLVVPCAYQRRYLGWAQGGGFRGEFMPHDIEPKLDQYRESDGRIVVDDVEMRDTRNHFLMVQSANGSWQPALLPMASSQIKKSKRWMSMIQSIEMRNSVGKPFNPPMFSHIYKLKPIKEENAKGSWWGIDITLVQRVEDAELYQKAKAFHNQVAAGEVQVQQPEEETESEGF